MWENEPWKKYVWQEYEWQKYPKQKSPSDHMNKFIFKNNKYINNYLYIKFNE